jgi:hypothetical protein
MKSIKYNFTSLNDLTIEKQKKPVILERSGPLTSNAFNVKQPERPYDPNGSELEDDKSNEMGQTKADWKNRGESMGGARQQERKYTFRIRKEGQVAAAKDKAFAPNQTNGFNRVRLDGIYTGVAKDRNFSAAAKEKQPFKEMSVNDRISKQMSIDKEGLKNRLNTFYNSKNGSREGNDEASPDVKQNNFLKTGGISGLNGTFELNRYRAELLHEG